jgi:ABC-type branched-subunit amino acid transport system substrate-binding protein
VGCSKGRRLLPLALGFFLLLSSCLPAVPRFPGAVRPTVKIGLVAPFEGRYRYAGYDVIYAVRMALREANVAGGVAGYGVELVAFDDGAEPAMAIEQARKLAADPELIAAIGHFREQTTAAALGAYAEAGIPLVAPAVYTPAITSGAAFHDHREAEVYRLGPSAEVLADALLHRLGALGHSQAALVTTGGPLGMALQQGVERLPTAAGTLQIWPVVSPDDPSWLEAVIGSGVRVVLCDAVPVKAGETASALRAAGWQGDFVGGPELAAPDFAAVAGRAAGEVVFVTPWPFPETASFPENLVSSEETDFAAAYRAVSNGVPPGPLASVAYEATWVLLEALERDVQAHGAPTREGIGAALGATRREGVLGRVAFDANHSWGDAPLYWYRFDVDGVPRISSANQPAMRW